MRIKNIEKHLCDAIAAMQEKHKVPGIAIGIIESGISCEFVNGITNVNNPVSVDENTLFQVASITKTINALLSLILKSEGKLDLDKAIINYFPEFQMSDEYVTKNATIMHILTHTGGWEGDIFECPDKGEDSLKECMRIAAALPQLTPPGTIWAYNSVGFYILGRVFEALLGKPYEQIVQDYVLTPLGMSNSVFSAGEAIVKKTVAGHYIMNNQMTVATPWDIPRYMRPGGGLICSLSDMMKYLIFLLSSDSETVLSIVKDDKEEMFKHRFNASGLADAVGLAWMLRYIDGFKIVRHGGVSLGQYSEILFVPEKNFGFVLLANGGEGFIVDLSTLLLKEYLNIDYRRTFPDPFVINKEELKKYKGVYQGPCDDIAVIPLENKLEIRHNYKKIYKDQVTIPDNPPPMSAVFYDVNRAYTVEDNIICDFFPDETGRMSFLRYGNKIHVSMDYHA